MPHTGPLRWALGPVLYQEHTDEEMTSSSSQANSISVIVTMALVKWMISLWISLCGCKKAPQVSKSSTRWTLVAVWHLTRAWEQAKVPFPEDRVCRGPSFSWSCSKEASRYAELAECYFCKQRPNGQLDMEGHRFKTWDSLYFQASPACTHMCCTTVIQHWAKVGSSLYQKPMRLKAIIGGTETPRYMRESC